MIDWLAEALIGLGVQVSLGFIGGFLAGYAAKKIAKVVAVIIGSLILFLLALNYLGVIIIRWEKLIGVGEETLTWLKAHGAGFAVFLLMNIPAITTFMAGFALGFKKG